MGIGSSSWGALYRDYFRAEVHQRVGHDQTHQDSGRVHDRPEKVARVLHEQAGFRSATKRVDGAERESDRAGSSGGADLPGNLFPRDDEELQELKPSVVFNCDDAHVTC